MRMNAHGRRAGGRSVSNGGLSAVCWAAMCMLLSACVSSADQVVRYEFTYTGVIETVCNPTVIDSHVTGTNYDFYSDASSSKGFAVSGGNPGGVYCAATTIFSTDAYMFFRLGIQSNYSLTISNLTFDSRRNVNSATNYDVKYSTNGSSFVSMGSGSVTGGTWQTKIADNGGVPVSNLTGTTYFRVYGAGWSGAADSNQNWYQDNVTVNGTVTAPAFTLTVSTTHGTTDPTAGPHDYDYGTVIPNSVVTPDTQGTTQYVCSGWAMTGNAPLSGTATNFTMTLTNNASLTWTWTTNYDFTRLAGANGSVTGNSNGWYWAGSSVTVTAVPDAHCHFAGWTGDVQGDTNNAAMTLTLNRPRTVAANFAMDTFTLTVSSAYGTSIPSGVTTSAWDTLVDASTISPVSNGGTQYVCTGWTGTGFVPSSGTNVAFSFNLTANSTLTWTWKTQYVLAVHRKLPGTPALDPDPFDFAILCGGSFDFGGCGPIASTNETVTMHANGAVHFVGNANVGGDVTKLNIESSTSITVQNNSTVDGDITAPVITLNPTKVTINGTISTAAVPTVSIPQLDLTPYYNWALAHGEVHPAGWAPPGGSTYTPNGGLVWVDGATGPFPSFGTLDGGVIAAGDIVISGDYNIVASADSFGFALVSRDGTIHNLSGGLIKGLIYVKNGDYTQTAYGSVHGQMICGGNVNLGGITWGMLFNRCEPQLPEQFGEMYWDYRGSVTPDNGWYDADSNLQVTAIASNGWHFSGWTGDVVSSANPLPLTMNRPYRLTTDFEINQYTLNVISSHGTTYPAPGAHDGDYGTVISNFAMTPDTQGTTQYVCAGWTMTDNEPLSGVTTNFLFTYTNNATLRWLWTTNYWLVPEASGHGTVGTSASWQAANTMAVIGATPDQYYYFTNWIGDVSGAQIYGNPLNLLMDDTKSVTAIFVENLASRCTPERWLAQYGWTNNFDAAETNDTDGDGHPAWKEYVADTDPTDPESRLRVVAISNLPDLTLFFSSSTGRLYTLQYSTNLLVDVWTNVADRVNLPGVGGPDSMGDTNMMNNCYYRMGVRQP